MKRLIFPMLTALLILLTGWRMVAADYGSSDHPQIAVPTACTPHDRQSTEILSVYVLAFDNDPTITNTQNLTTKAHATLQSITSATASNPDVIAVVLADLDQANDTQLYVAINGILSPLDCLPDIAGELDESLVEYDTTDGKTLGGLLVWSQATFPATRNLFSFIGHGSFFAPATDQPISEMLDLNGTARALDPLPDRKDVNPAYTDFHLPDEEGSRLITPHDLATAFAAGIEAGGARFDVIDLLHCFAGSIEEFYELRDYASYITGSPNYAFFDPDMTGTALAVISPVHSAENIAQIFLLAYQSLIPSTQHPYVALAVETDQLGAVKVKWDSLAAAILDEFDTDEATTANRLEAAYTNSFHFDTTFCEDPNELQLAPPDALSDMVSFNAEIASEFNGSPVATIANDMSTVLYDTLPFNQTFYEGSPWFYEGMGAAPVWEWHGGGEAFFSIFTPFQLWTANDGMQYHTWQSLWYSSTQSYELDGVTIENPHPYAFIQRRDGEPTWADVIARYWQVRGERPGVDVDTAFCAPPLRGLFPGSAEIALTIDDRPDRVQTGQLVTYTVEIQHFGGTTATLLSIVHTLSPSMTLHSAPANCQLNAPHLVCPRPDLPPQETDEYQIVVRMLAPGNVPFSGELSMLQTGGEPTASETTSVTGVPLAVGLGEGRVESSQMVLPLRPVLLSFTLLTLWILIVRRRRQTE